MLYWEASLRMRDVVRIMFVQLFELSFNYKIVQFVDVIVTVLVIVVTSSN